MRLTLLLVLAALLGSGHPPGLLAQERAFAFQLRGGGFLPLGDLRKAEAGWEGEAGPHVGFGMGFTLPLRGRLGTYLGFSQYRFSCDSALCPDGENWEATGFDVALRLILGGRRSLRSWLQGGLHTHRLKGRLYDAGGAEVETLTSKGGGGLEVGGGLLVQIGERTSLSPGIRYGIGTVPFSGRDSMHLNYVVMDLGLVVGF